MKIVTLVHRIFISDNVKPGGIDYVNSYLEKSGHEVILVEHPLSGSHVSQVRIGNSIKKYRIPFSGPPRWLLEALFNFYKIATFGKLDLIIAVDPLNFISAYILSIFTHTKIQFHAVDFSEKRFGIKILDFIYREIYYFALHRASFVTYVSTNMFDIVNPRSRRCVFFPNSPEFKKATRIDPKSKNKFEIVYTKSNISSSEADMLIELTCLLKRSYPNILLNVIGAVESATKSKVKELHLQKNLQFHGLIDYLENLNIVSRSYIGIAWYENIKSFEKYADSLKIREYAACGLPVVCNRLISTALEANREGLLFLCDNVTELDNSICKLIKDNNLYLDMREKALSWAKKNDKTVIINKLYKSIGLLEDNKL